MGLDIKWHHCFSGPSGIPLLTAAQSKQKFQFSGGFQTGLFFLKRITQHNNNKHLGSVCLQVCLYLPRSYRILPKLFAWLFWAIRQHAVSIVLPTIIFCVGFLLQSLAWLGKSQRLGLCSGLTSSLLGMPVNALTTATEQLTRAVIQKTADSKRDIAAHDSVHYLIQEHDNLEQMDVLTTQSCVLASSGQSHSQNRNCAEGPAKANRGSFSMQGRKMLQSPHLEHLPNSRRNNVLFIWQETIPDHTAYCFLGHSH